jgi:hypothetical protein
MMEERFMRELLDFETISVVGGLSNVPRRPLPPPEPTKPKPPEEPKPEPPTPTCKVYCMRLILGWECFTVCE